MLEIDALKTPLIGPISLQIAPAAPVAILGPSGAGKSLLLRAIVDLDPNEGAARLNGAAREAMPAHEWRRQVALVPAESGWWSDVASDHFPAGVDPAPLLQAVGLPDAAASWRIERLSTGERQRMALARALLGAPKALLLDEPTAALDAAATAKVESLIAARALEGLAILFVTHDPAQARRLAARRFQMALGRLTEEPADARELLG